MDMTKLYLVAVAECIRDVDDWHPACPRGRFFVAGASRCVITEVEDDVTSENTGRRMKRMQKSL